MDVGAVKEYRLLSSNFGGGWQKCVWPQSAAVACDDVDLAHLGKCPIDDLPNGFAIGYVQRRHPKTVAISRPKVVKGAFLAKGYRLIIPHPMSAEATRALRLAIRKSKSELEKASRTVREKRQSGS
jgi:hypothetical protein